MEKPILVDRRSESECSKSSQSNPSGSLKTVAASSKETPWFFRLARALRASQENTLVYIH